MSKLFDYYMGGEDDDACNPRKRMFLFSNPKESDLSSQNGSRIMAPFVFTSSEETSSIEVLPDECLYEIFRRLRGGKGRSICACVSKRWLMLLGSIHRNDIFNKENTTTLVEDGEIIEIETRVLFNNGFLSRDLEGKKANDTRLVALAIGTASRGGLGKLSITGSNPVRGVTNLGLKAVANNCPYLRVLSLWNLPSIDDEALIDVANGCPLLKRLDLCDCPTISDMGLIPIVKKCPNLTSIIIESCPRIGNHSLQAVGCYCRNLTLWVKNCSSIDDNGIVSLFPVSTEVSTSISKLKLEGLNVGDVALAIIGNYGSSLTEVSLFGLQNMTMRGFWAMGNIHGLQKVRSLAIVSCCGFNDVGLDAISKGCPSLNRILVKKCSFITDKGLSSFAKSAGLLVSLKLEECHGITEVSVFGSKLKALALVNCMGLKHVICDSNRVSLRSLVIRNCPRFDDASLAAVGQTCLQLENVVLSGLQGLTDMGIETLVNANQAGFVKLNLSNCVNLTDRAVSLVANVHGSTLEGLNLRRCGHLTDASLKAIAENCPLLAELNVSKTRITDSGIAVLAREVNLTLLTLSVAGCSRVSDKCFPGLIELGRYLMNLDIQDCKGISSHTVDDLLEQLRQCDIIY